MGEQKYSVWEERKPNGTPTHAFVAEDSRVLRSSDGSHQYVKIDQGMSYREAKNLQTQLIHEQKDLKKIQR